jgi:DNA-binding IclR family transcriptional regulator
MDEASISQWIGASVSAERAEKVRAALKSVRDRGFSVGLVSDAQRAFAAKLHELAQTANVAGTPDLAELIKDLDYDPQAIDETSGPAVRLISAPVFDANGRVVYALTLHDFRRPTSAEDVNLLASRLRRTVADLSDSLPTS